MPNKYITIPMSPQFLTGMYAACAPSMVLGNQWECSPLTEAMIEEINNDKDGQTTKDFLRAQWLFGERDERKPSGELETQLPAGFSRKVSRKEGARPKIEDLRLYSWIAPAKRPWPGKSLSLKAALLDYEALERLLRKAKALQSAGLVQQEISKLEQYLVELKLYQAKQQKYLEDKKEYLVKRELHSKSPEDNLLPEPPEEPQPPNEPNLADIELVLTQLIDWMESVQKPSELKTDQQNLNLSIAECKALSAFTVAMGEGRIVQAGSAWGVESNCFDTGWLLLAQDITTKTEEPRARYEEPFRLKRLKDGSISITSTLEASEVAESKNPSLFLRAAEITGEVKAEEAETKEVETKEAEDTMKPGVPLSPDGQRVVKFTSEQILEKRQGRDGKYTFIMRPNPNKQKVEMEENFWKNVALERAKNKLLTLEENKEVFRPSDLFAFIPYLINDDFRELFIAKLVKQPEFVVNFAKHWIGICYIEKPMLVDDIHTAIVQKKSKTTTDTLIKMIKVVDESDRYQVMDSCDSISKYVGYFYDPRSKVGFVDLFAREMQVLERNHRVQYDELNETLEARKSKYGTQGDDFVAQVQTQMATLPPLLSLGETINLGLNKGLTRAKEGLGRAKTAAKSKIDDMKKLRRAQPFGGSSEPQAEADPSDLDPVDDSSDEAASAELRAVLKASAIVEAVPPPEAAPPADPQFPPGDAEDGSVPASDLKADDNVASAPLSDPAPSVDASVLDDENKHAGSQPAPLNLPPSPKAVSSSAAVVDGSRSAFNDDASAASAATPKLSQPPSSEPYEYKRIRMPYAYLASLGDRVYRKSLGEASKDQTPLPYNKEKIKTVLSSRQAKIDGPRTPWSFGKQTRDNTGEFRENREIVDLSPEYLTMLSMLDPRTLSIDLDGALKKEKESREGQIDNSWIEGFLNTKTKEFAIANFIKILKDSRRERLRMFGPLIQNAETKDVINPDTLTLESNLHNIRRAIEEYEANQKAISPHFLKVSPSFNPCVELTLAESEALFAYSCSIGDGDEVKQGGCTRRVTERLFAKTWLPLFGIGTKADGYVTDGHRLERMEDGAVKVVTTYAAKTWCFQDSQDPDELQSKVPEAKNAKYVAKITLEQTLVKKGDNFNLTNQMVQVSFEHGFWEKGLLRQANLLLSELPSPITEEKAYALIPCLCDETFRNNFCKELAKRSRDERDSVMHWIEVCYSGHPQELGAIKSTLLQELRAIRNTLLKERFKHFFTGNPPRSAAIGLGIALGIAGAVLAATGVLAPLGVALGLTGAAMATPGAVVAVVAVCLAAPPFLYGLGVGGVKAVKGFGHWMTTRARSSSASAESVEAAPLPPPNLRKGDSTREALEGFGEGKKLDSHPHPASIGEATAAEDFDADKRHPASIKPLEVSAPSAVDSSSPSPKASHNLKRGGKKGQTGQ